MVTATNIRIALILLLAAMTSACISDPPDSSAKSRIDYIPFQVETYAAITPQTIEKQSQYSRRLSKEDFDFLVSSLHTPRHPVSFDAKNVRVKISDNQVSYFIDRNGVAISAGRTYLVDKALVSKRVDTLRTPAHR